MREAVATAPVSEGVRKALRPFEHREKLVLPKERGRRVSRRQRGVIGHPLGATACCCCALLRLLANQKERELNPRLEALSAHPKGHQKGQISSCS